MRDHADESVPSFAIRWTSKSYFSNTGVRTGEGLANSELRGTILRILPAGEEERAWRDSLAALVRGFSASD
jgi:hypothetical protein